VSNLGELLEEFLTLTDQVDTIDTALAHLKKRRAGVEERLRTEFTQVGVSQLKATDGRVVYLSRTLWARAKDGDKLAVTRALRSIGAADLVTETFNTNSLSAYVREFDKDDREIPAVLADVITVAETFQLKVLAG
jgi:hypothetical protein